MQNLKKDLKDRLSSWERLAVIGVGSELRADDACGVIAAKKLKQALDGEIKKGRVAVFIGATAPENITSQLRHFAPTHVLIIDSCSMSASAGEARLIDPRDIRGVSFSTHRMPLGILAEYLKASLGCEVALLGIQPEDIAFGSPVCARVSRSIDNVCAMIKEILSA